MVKLIHLMLQNNCFQVMNLKEKLNKLSIIELVIIAEPHTDYTDEAKTYALDLLNGKNWENSPHVFDEIKKAKSSLEQNEITKDNADSSLILESVRHYFNLIKFKNAVALSEIENDYQRSRYRVSSRLYENGSISVEEYETLKNNYESSKND